MGRLARGVFKALEAFGASRVPEPIKVGGIVAAICGLATYQVFHGRSKGQALSQEKPEVLQPGKGPRNLEEEKAKLKAQATAAEATTKAATTTST